MQLNLTYIKMKKIVYITLALTILASCKPEIKGELGEPHSKVEGLNGTWKLTAFSQRDENNPIKEVRDLSEFYILAGEESTVLSFNASDFTYTVVPGPGKNYFGESGTWRFDSNEAPSYLYLQSDTDTLQIKLGSMPVTYLNNLTLELPRFCTDNIGVQTPTVTYIFNIQRAN